MKYHALKPGPMQETGRSLLRLIQNTEIPPLDLLVREAVQNSLDAAKTAEQPVKVSFRVKEHSPDAIAALLPEIATGLIRKWPGKQQLLEIRDTGTCGLTGPVSREIKGGRSGNFVKLVYEISKPQEQADAGGSWGLGKTVYYRMGSGLVFYYSRIETGYGKHEERLAACFVENEQQDDRVMTDSDTGIAWWGGDEVTYRDIAWPAALTDPVEIGRIIEHMGVEPFKRDETGTSIIIPFLREDLLSLDQNSGPRWYGGLSGYIKYAIYRWYAVRLGNMVYTDITGRPWLEADVNGENASIAPPPVFRVIRALYSLANARECAFGTKTEPAPEDILIGDIELRSETFAGEPYAGWVAAVRLTAEQLGMTSPENMKSPHMYLLNQIDETSNLPIIAYLRSPGMIVRWNDAKWQRGLKPSEDGSYIIAIFVPYSKNRFSGKMKDKTGCSTMEEYLRSIEKADHAGWTDSAGLNIIQRTVTNVQNRINAKFFPVEEIIPGTHTPLALSRRLANAFLPQGFGGGGGNPSLPPLQEPPVPATVGVNPSFHVDKLDYQPGKISMTWSLFWGKGTAQEQVIRIHVATTGTSIGPDQWSADGLALEDFPFTFSEFSMESIVNRQKGQNPSTALVLNTTGPDRIQDNRIELTKKPSFIRMRNISPKSFSSWAFTGKMTIDVKPDSYGFSPVIQLETIEMETAVK